MLLLGRRKEQGLWIGDTHVRILAIKGSRVTLGIEAPNGVRVLRDEIVAEIDTDIDIDEEAA